MAGCKKILTDDYFCGAFFRGRLRLCDECKRKELEEENLRLENKKLKMEIEKLRKEIKQKERK